MGNFPNINKMQRNLWIFGLFKIPMIAYCRPRITVWNEEEVVIRIKRSRRTNNHLKSMYFGALMVGADLAAGMHAFAYSSVGSKKISLAFKSCQANFIQRPETDVFFEAKAGAIVREMIKKSEQSKERVNAVVLVKMYDENRIEIAQAQMELSIKVK